MTARKSASKSPASRKASAKKKPSAAKQKTAARKKTPAKKKTVAKKKAPAKEKAPAKKKAAATRALASPPAPRPEPAEGAQPQGSALSLQVNLGHVFQLRPRVNTSFRQEDFRTARHLLESQAFASLEEAARAVVEKALELTHAAGDTGGAGFRP